MMPVADDVPSENKKLAVPTAGNVDAVAVIITPVLDGTVVKVLAYVAKPAAAPKVV